MATNLQLDMVDFTALRRQWQRDVLSEWSGSLRAALTSAYTTPASEQIELPSGVHVCELDPWLPDGSEPDEDSATTQTAAPPNEERVDSDDSELATLHIMAAGEGGYAVFHPQTLTLFRANALAIAVLERWKAHIPIAAIAEQHNLASDDIRELLAQIRRAIRSQPGLTIEEHEPDSLERLVMQVSNRCNLHCRYCFAAGGSYRQPITRMSPAIARQAIDCVVERYSDIRTLMFFGGEPTLNPAAIQACCERLNEWFERGRLTHLPLWGLVTNGLMLSQRMEQLIRDYRLAVTVSLDGPAAIHDSLRPTPAATGSFQRIARTIRRLQEITAGAEPSKIEVTFTAAHRSAGIGIQDLVGYIDHEFGISDVHIAPVLIERRNELFWDPREDAEMLHTAVQDIIDGWRVGSLRHTQLISSGMHTFVTHSRSAPTCGAGRSELTIFPNGDIYPCYMFVQDTLNMGNVTQPQVLASQQFRAIQHSFHQRAEAHVAPCASCWARGLCHVCLKAAYTESQPSTHMPEWVCAQNRIIAEALLLTLSRLSAQPEAWSQLGSHVLQIMRANLKKHLDYWA